MSFKKFIKELEGGRVEGELIKTTLYSLVTSLIFLAILYYLKLRYVEYFIPKYGFYLFFSVLSFAIIVPSIRQVRAYKEFACMSGMMIGMTIGMVSGFLLGFYIGATNGGIVVLDEFVESRPDARVLLHSLTDDRRVLPVAKKGEVITPPDNFMVVVCYNPGYQVRAKELKASTRQRFPTIEMDYPPAEIEKKILIKRTGIDDEVADKLVRLAGEIRNAKHNDTLRLQEGASTRLLIMAGEYYQMYKKMGKESDLKHIARINIFHSISSVETDRKALEKMLDGL